MRPSRYFQNHFIRRILLFFFLCLPITIQASTGICKNSTEIIPLQFRNASEVLPIIKDMLSENGKASIDIRTNSVVITDNDESIRKIRTFLERFDTPPRQVRVRVNFQEERSSKDNSLSAEGTVSGEKWKITTSRKKQDGIDVRLHDRNRKRSRSSEYFVNVLSGSPAHIIAGKDIIYRERWGYLLKRYAGYTDTIYIERIESGMDVRPVIVGDHANIEIIPRISYEVSRGRRETIQFTEAATTLSVPLGQWVTISGTDENSNEVIREILKTGSSKKNSSLAISLMVEEN
ncbi:secretin N-terminal domain-containing protein [Thermodesulfobacteriota bacterium]